MNNRAAGFMAFEHESVDLVEQDGVLIPQGALLTAYAEQLCHHGLQDPQEFVSARLFMFNNAKDYHDEAVEADQRVPQSVMSLSTMMNLDPRFTRDDGLVMVEHYAIAALLIVEYGPLFHGWQYAKEVASSTTDAIVRLQAQQCCEDLHQRLMALVDKLVLQLVQPPGCFFTKPNEVALLRLLQLRVPLDPSPPPPAEAIDLQDAARAFLRAGDPTTFWAVSVNCLRHRPSELERVLAFACIQSLM